MQTTPYVLNIPDKIRDNLQLSQYAVVFLDSFKLQYDSKQSMNSLDGSIFF